MPLLYDRIRELDPTFPNCPVIDATVIQTRIDALPAELPQSAATDYAVVAPPFPTFFIEATTPSTDPREQGQLISRGMICRTIDIASAGYPPHYQGFLTPLPGAYWAVLAMPYIFAHDLLWAPSSTALLQIDRDGNLLDDTFHIQIAIEPADNPPRPGQLSHAHAATLLPFVLTTISALHRQCEVIHHTPNRTQRRQAVRRNQPPPHEHYTLKVFPGAVRIISDIARPDPNRTTPRGHTVRGHFKYYTPDRPRFGRAGEHGMFHVKSFEKGETSIGTISKTYQIVESPLEATLDA